MSSSPVTLDAHLQNYMLLNIQYLYQCPALCVKRHNAGVKTVINLEEGETNKKHGAICKSSLPNYTKDPRLKISVISFHFKVLTLASLPPHCVCQSDTLKHKRREFYSAGFVDRDGSALTAVNSCTHRLCGHGHLHRATALTFCICVAQ